MQKITPFLWFDGNAEEAAQFYVSLFTDSGISSIMRQGPDGPVITVGFKLNGQDYVGLNGGPMFKFTEAVSFCINCDTQEEIDRYWDALTADGGEESMCGWLKDKYGLSWQVVPAELPKLLTSDDPQKAGNAMQALMKMKKLDIARLREAYNQ